MSIATEVQLIRAIDVGNAMRNAAIDNKYRFSFQLVISDLQYLFIIKKVYINSVKCC